jgi:hypothetical protein
METKGDYTEKQNAQFRVRQELKIKLLEAMENFKSETEPDYEPTNMDIIYVLSSMIARGSA